MNLTLWTTQNTAGTYTKCHFSDWKEGFGLTSWCCGGFLPTDRGTGGNRESHYCTQKQHINVKYKSDRTAYITSVITFTPNFITKLKLETPGQYSGTRFQGTVKASCHPRHSGQTSRLPTAPIICPHRCIFELQC